MAEELKPCPFCGSTLERSEALSNRKRSTFIHPADALDCILSHTIVTDDPARVAAWNTRLNPPAASGGENT